MNVYHGHEVIDNEHGWQVGITDTQARTRRSIVRCPYDNSQRNNVGTVVTRMLAGYNVNEDGSGIWPNTDQTQNNPNLDQVSDSCRFAQLLFQQGYLSAAAFNLILSDRDRLGITRYGEYGAARYEKVHS